MLCRKAVESNQYDSVVHIGNFGENWKILGDFFNLEICCRWTNKSQGLVCILQTGKKIDIQYQHIEYHFQYIHMMKPFGTAFRLHNAYTKGRSRKG